MKEIKAIVQPFMLSKVIGALQQMRELPGVTVSEVRGFGRRRAGDEENGVMEDCVEYAPKAKLEIVVSDHLVEPVVAVILARARTGNPGDGKIFVYPIEDVIKIRTQERGEAAI